MIKLDEYFYSELDIVALIKGSQKDQESGGLPLGILLIQDDKGIIIWFGDLEEFKAFIDELYGLLLPGYSGELTANGDE